MRRVLRALGALGLLCVLPVLYLGSLVLWPHGDYPGHADALVVLSGDHGERLAAAKKLLAAGVAPTLVLAGEPDMAEDIALCQGGQTFEVVCLRPNPDSTRFEARATTQLASNRHWRTLAVVTSTTHVARARLLFKRCFPGTVKVVGANLPFGGSDARKAEIHEWLGLIYAEVLARGC